MNQLLNNIKLLLNTLTETFIVLRGRTDALEKRSSENEVYIDKELDARDVEIEKLRNEVSTLTVKLSFLETRVTGLETPVFKPPKKPVPWNLEPWWKPAPIAPIVPPWNPTIPVNPLPNIPTIPNPIPSYPPSVPSYPTLPVWCQKCGLNQDIAAGYCCMRLDCPDKAISTCNKL